MLDLPSLKRETRYGMPAADQVMFNRHYVLGYSYYFRQAKWALEIVSPEKDDDDPDVDRADNFRPDYRVPEMFRADLPDYKGSGYDRGHLVASANKLETEIENSETFLLSNMSPQKPRFNRDIWRKLERAVRQLDAREDILETYVICGPIFFFNQEVKTIESERDQGITLPIPHAYFKSVLTENHNGRLDMWSFIIPNEKSDKPLSDFLVPTTTVEKMSGLFLWERLVGCEIEKMRSKKREMW